MKEITITHKAQPAVAIAAKQAKQFVIQSKNTKIATIETKEPKPIEITVK